MPSKSDQKLFLLGVNFRTACDCVKVTQKMSFHNKCLGCSLCGCFFDGYFKGLLFEVPIKCLQSLRMSARIYDISSDDGHQSMRMNRQNHETRLQPNYRFQHR